MTIFTSAAARNEFRSANNTVAPTSFGFTMADIDSSEWVDGDIILCYPVSELGLILSGEGGITLRSTRLDSGGAMLVTPRIFSRDGTTVKTFNQNMDLMQDTTLLEVPITDVAVTWRGNSIVSRPKFITGCC